MGADLRTRKYRDTAKIYACILMSLFLVSCIDGVSLPEFPQIKKQKTEKTVSSQDEERVIAPVKKIKTETLLDEEGNWNLVEKSEAIDPMQAHLEARNEVDVKRRKNKKELSAHFKPDAKSGEDGKMRVLRLEADARGIKDHEIAGSSISKPSQTVAEGELLSKVKSLFGDRASDNKGIIVPKRKPVLRAAPVQEKRPVKVDSGFEGFVSKKPTASEDRMVKGFIIPPILPQRRFKNKPRKAKQPENIVKTQKEEPVVTQKGVVVPKRKPLQKAGLAKRSPKTAPSKIVPVKKPRPKKALSKAESSAPSAAIRLRSGRHPGKTRLVIEVTRATKYKVAIDPVRNVLRIKLDATLWRLSPQESFTKSGLLGTYIAREQKDGSIILEIRLKKKTKILDTMVLRPNLTSKYRVVIDLKD